MLRRLPTAGGRGRFVSLSLRLVGGLGLMLATSWAWEAPPMMKLTLKNSEALPAMSPLLHAVYLKPQGLEMIRHGAYSPDNGRTWQTFPLQPDFDKDLPYGYRRERFPLFVDYHKGRVLWIVPSMDTEGLDPTIEEPPEALQTYYLRYRVSADGGRHWLFDEVVMTRDGTLTEPIPGVVRGRNGIFMGDVGSQVIRTRQGKILVPAQACLLGPDGRLANPGGGFTYTDVVILLGSWRKDDRLRWEAVRLQGDPARTTRGLIEPSLAEFPDGRLLCVMRGSNGGSKDPDYRLPGYRWFSVSRDGGYHWTTPEPWTYEDGTPFYSPSSMSQLLRHSSGAVFWIGNICPENPRGNHPRHPLVIGQVEPRSLRLWRATVLVVDDKRPEEPDVNLSHFWALEDRETHDIVIAGARYSQGYKETHPHLWRVGVARER